MTIHVDMDAFYASVEQREQPDLRGKPIIVGGTPEGRGVVAAASYEARRSGVHSAMATAKALRLCPDAVVLPPRMEFYAEVSRQIREIFHRYTPQVEPLSLDEAFLDVSGSTQLFGNEQTIGRAIKDQIAGELHLVASVGVAPNKFLAKLASDLEKPDGFTVIEEQDVLMTLAPLSVSRIWGVGRVTRKRMENHGILTIGDLQDRTESELEALFGGSGEHFWKLSHGIDHRDVVPDREAKSISHETTFAQDIRDPETLRAWLLELTEQVGRRLRRQKVTGRTVQLKVRYSNFDTITRARSLPQATSTTQILWEAVAELLKTQLPDRPLVVRLLGMGVTNLQRGGCQQLSLFETDSKSAAHDRNEQLDDVADKIRSRFGVGALRRAATVQQDAVHRPQPRPE